VARHHWEQNHDETAGPVMAVYFADSLLRGGAELDRALARMEALGLAEELPQLAAEWRFESRPTC
jgi:hypothetical protein